MKRRLSLAIVVGLCVFAAAYVVLRTMRGNIDLSYSLPQSDRQLIIKAALEHTLAIVAQEGVPCDVYINLDKEVDVQKIIADLPKIGNLNYRKGYRGSTASETQQQSLKGRLTRVVSVTIVAEDRRRVLVSTGLSYTFGPGAESAIITFERKWWRWVMTKSEVTTVF